MFKTILVASLLVTSFLGTALARQPEEEINPAAFQITEMSVTEVEPGEYLELPTAPTNPVTEVIAIIDSMIAIGKKIWPIIEAGRPVINSKLAPAVSVLPHLEGTDGVLSQMENWSVPKVKSYRFSAKNLYNSEVVGFTYTIFYQYGGDLNGVGKYITGLKIDASEVSVSWGFSFDATSELVSIANVGSKEAPVASATFAITYAVKAINREDRHTNTFYVDGKGNIQLLTH